ncbi:MAG: 50S ribosomal protein L35 [Verrucomicrobiota bacterium]
MSKAKTRKAVAKRFKVSATGKVKASRAGRRHLAASKNAKRKRRLASSKLLAGPDAVHVKENLPFG